MLDPLAKVFLNAVLYFSSKRVVSWEAPIRFPMIHDIYISGRIIATSHDVTLK